MTFHKTDIDVLIKIDSPYMLKLLSHYQEMAFFNSGQIDLGFNF